MCDERTLKRLLPFEAAGNGDKNKTTALSQELLEVEENVRKIKIGTDALKRIIIPALQELGGCREHGEAQEETDNLGNTLVEGSRVVEDVLFDILRRYPGFNGQIINLITIYTSNNTHASNLVRNQRN